MAVYTGTNASEYLGGTFNPLEEADVLYGLGGDDNLQGYGGNDALYGGNGNDALLAYNYGGADELYGEKGNDTYIIGSGDVVIETAGNGQDRIDLWYDVTGVYTIPSNVEILDDRGTAAIVGNNLNNTINVIGSDNRSIDGGNGNDTLNGFNGADTLIGGRGNDNLNGGSNNDILVGGFGNDTLLNYSGSDLDVFDTGRVFSTSTIGIDSIAGFTIGEDKIVLDKTTFNNLTSAVGNGFSVASEFTRVTTDTDASSSSALIVFNSTSGALFYNQNGIDDGFGTGGQFATISSASSLDTINFVIQA